MTEYARASSPKALAISPAGIATWVRGKNAENRALDECEKLAKTCFVYATGDHVSWFDVRLAKSSLLRNYAVSWGNQEVIYRGREACFDRSASLTKISEGEQGWIEGTFEFQGRIETTYLHQNGRLYCGHLEMENAGHHFTPINAAPK